MRSHSSSWSASAATYLLTIVVLSVYVPTRTAAQPVGSDSGPLSEVSRPLSDTSRPVHERGRTVSEGSVGSMKSGPVRGGRRLGMLSGPVSEISAGPVGEGRSMRGGGSVAENSSGAVKQEMDRSLGEQIYDLQRALGPLQASVREQAARDAEDAGQEAPQDVLEPHMAPPPETDGELLDGEDAAAAEDTQEPAADVPADSVDDGSDPAEENAVN